MLTHKKLGKPAGIDIELTTVFGRWCKVVYWEAFKIAVATVHLESTSVHVHTHMHTHAHTRTHAHTHTRTRTHVCSST